MAALTTLTIAWSGMAVACIVLVAVAALAVRPFWRYDARRAGDLDPVVPAAAGPAEGTGAARGQGS